jgi:hypothetical protein
MLYDGWQMKINLQSIFIVAFGSGMARKASLALESDQPCLVLQFAALMLSSTAGRD